MKKKINIFLILGLGLLLVACSTAPLTGRKQLKFVSDESIIQSSTAQYNKMIGDLKKENLLANNTAEGRRLAEIGRRVTGAVDEYLRENQMQDILKNLKWEYNLIQSNQINAFALPGGKIAFYTAIIPVLQTDGAIAYVMGHEIGHVIGGHHAERASGQTFAGYIMAGKKILDSATNGLTGLVSNDLAEKGLAIGLLKFNRTQEYEADKYGMICMAMAGYNPEEAIIAEERMMKMSGSGQTLEILSTHPSSEKRVEELKKFLPEAMKYYRAR